MLKQSGIEATTVTEHLARGTADPVWLEYCGKNNLIAISKDKKIRYSPLSLAAINNFHVKLFILSEGNLTGEDIAQRIIQAMSKIRRFNDSNQGPFIVKIYRGGIIKKVYPGKGFQRIKTNEP